MDSPGDPTVIIGGGLTGISTALHLQRPYVVLEREHEVGGLARTDHKQGFWFDRTGHWLHLRDPGIKELVTGLMGDELVQVDRRARIYSHGAHTLYPFQANLHGLPPEVVNQCLMGFIRTLLQRGDEEPRNFEEYIQHHFGDGIARHFMVPYNSKLWGVHPSEITSAWCQRFVPIPDPEQVVAGAVGAGPAELGYNISFLYPRQGGIQTMTRALAAQLDPAQVRTHAAVEAVDTARRTVSVGGEDVPYHALVSSAPLPELLAMLRPEPPDEVLEAAGWLRATPVRYLDVGSRTRPPQDYHWVYVPEERLPFYRVGVYSNAVESMAPPGGSSLYVELASRAPGHDPQAEIADALAALVEAGALASTEDVVVADLREIDHAYVVFDDNYEQALGRIFPYLERHRIYSRGRYGSWIYNSMEDSLIAGREVAALINQLPAREGA